VNAVHSLPYLASDGKQYTRDFVGDNELYRIAAFMKATKPRRAMKAVKNYLANAGAFADLARREPETVEAMLAEQRRKKYLRAGKEDFWISTRNIGVVTRNQIMELVMALLGKEQANKLYGTLTNDTYRGLFGKSAAELREYLGLPQGANLRDSMNILGLSFIIQAEAMVSIQLQAYAPDDIVRPEDVRNVFIILSKLVGKHVKETENQLGLDVVTGRKFLESGDDNQPA
jgi:hypothetical protein